MISSNVSSIMSNQTYMNNSANNVAKVNTDRFTPQNTVIQESSKNSIQAVTSRATDTKSEKSQTNLTKEITDQVSIEKVTQANVNAIRTQDNMLGSLLDIKA